MAPPGRRRHTFSSAAVLLGLAFLCAHTASAASAVLGVDLGTEYIKAALVKPGIPLEIVLTKDSKRKEISAVAFKPSKGGAVLVEGEYPERFYGSDAIALSARFPGEVYPSLKQLLGVASDGSQVGVYKSRYPALTVEGVDGRKTVALRSGLFAAEEKTFSVEELLAMKLKNVRENAKALAGKGSDVSEAVFTVPPFYTVQEKRALEVAAQLAGLKVLSIVSDGVAVGINYATSRTFPNVKEGGKPEVNLVFDMGAGSTSATVLQFQSKTVKDVGRYNKTIQEIQVLGAGWDRTLGGDALNSVIVKDMVSSFVAGSAAKSASLTVEKVQKHGRAASKLWKDAEKVRQVLSANTATQTSFESFLEDVDFKYKITRPQFEELAASLAERVDGPINRALEAAGLTLADIDALIVHGGASRTPFVQQRLEALVGKAKMKANVNSDEAAVFGAAFKAAGLSPSFRVKEIRDLDTQGYTQGIQYMSNLKNLDQKIFLPSTQIGTVKDIPFKMMGEFEFTMYEAAPDADGALSKEPILHFASGNLTKVVTQFIDSGCDKETFNTYVQTKLGASTGIPEVTSAWVTCETDNDTKGSIVDGVKNFFGMGDKKDQEPLKEGETASSETSSSSSSSKASKSAKSSKSSSSGIAAEASDVVKAIPKKKTVRSAIAFTVTQKGYDKHPRKEYTRMQDRLAAFDVSDNDRRAREEHLNSLEAFTYRARDYLDDESFIVASIAEVRTSLEEKLSAASEWIYSGGSDATQEVLKAKLKELKDIVDPILLRKKNKADRPDLIKAFEDNLKDIKSALSMVQVQIADQEKALSSSAKAASKASEASAQTPSPSPSDILDDLEADDMLKPSESEAVPEVTEVPIIYTAEDQKLVEDAISSATKWLEEKQAAQAKLQDSDDPVLTSEAIKVETEKLNSIIVNMMMKKSRVYNNPNFYTKPKPKKAKKASKKSKKEKKPKNDGAKPENSPTQEELDDVLEKAGLKGSGAKFKNFGKQELKDKDGKPLVQLDITPDSTEEEIMAAIDRVTKEGQKKAKEEEAKKVRDEL